jgi:hypothetical protein
MGHRLCCNVACCTLWFLCAGSFGGRQPTQNHSLVTGLYRLHLDDTGHITDVWVSETLHGQGGYQVKDVWVDE